MEAPNIHLTLPIKISYPVLRQLLDAKLLGMQLGSRSRKYATIVGTSLEASQLPEFDIVLGLRLGLGRKIGLPKEIPVFVHGSLDYDSENGSLNIGAFKMDAKGKNFLLDKALKFFVNRMYYRKVLDKASYDLNALLGPYLDRLNEKLQSGVLMFQGALLQGNLENITVSKIEVHQENVLVYALFDGSAEVAISEIPDESKTFNTQQ